MAIPLKPRHLKRYGDVARLLAKHGGSDLLRGAGADADVPEELLADLEGGELGAGDPEELARDLERLGPTFIKLGQVLSSRPDLLSAPYIEALSRLQDRVEPFPADEVERIVVEELGVRISKAFTEFELEPMAAASLGQVHRAALRDGREVAVKVQRPGIRAQIVEDLDALGNLAEALDRHTKAGRRYAFGDMLEQFRSTLLHELDYREEARNLLTLAENLESHPEIVIPRPIDDYTTGRVLTMQLVRGTKVSDLSSLRRLELHVRPLAEALVQAYLDQVLVDGFFHADPHPGNVFVTDDGQLALIDVGMVQRVDPEVRRSFLKVVLAVADGRGREAADLSMGLSVRLKGADPRKLSRNVADMVARFRDAEVGELQVGRVLMELSRLSAEHGFRPLPEFTVLGKTLLHLDEVARTLAPELDPNDVVREYADSLMRRHVLRSVTPQAFFSTLLETGELVERLPQRVNSILGAMAENRFRLKVDAVDQEQFIASLEHIANRITAGLVLTALIVGAALLMRVDTELTIFGYPALAMALFLLAAAFGFGLVVAILLEKGGRSRREEEEHGAR